MSCKYCGIFDNSQYWNFILLFSKRCDNNLDCEDMSDEDDCAFIRMRPGYSKELVPKPAPGKPAVVNTLITIQDIPDIDTFNTKLTVDYTVMMDWEDGRLEYHNLNTGFFDNALLKSDVKENIWIPVLSMENGLGAIQTINDEQSSVYINRETDVSTFSDIDQSHEGFKVDLLFIIYYSYNDIYIN